MKLAVLTSHPIQYQVPIWREIARRNISFEAWYLSKQGIEVSSDEEFNKEFQWDIDLISGYQHEFLEVVSPTNMNHFNGIKLSENLQARIRRQKIDYLWIEGWRFSALWDAVKSARRTHTRVWMRGESNNLKRQPFWKKIAKKTILGFHFRRVDSFLFIGEANRDFYKSYGISDERLFSAPYCVDHDRFLRQADFLRSRRDKIRSSWQISFTAKVILFCGKFIEKKHPHHVVEAITRLQKASPNEEFHLLFVGSGPLGNRLRDCCNVVFDAENGVRDNGTAKDTKICRVKASFVGFLNQSEIAAAYVAADLLVLPSDAGETWGLVVNEAMACGTPAVTSNLVGCSSDLPAKLDRNSVYSFGDISHLAHSINALLVANWSVAEVRAVAVRCHLNLTVDCVEKLISFKA